MAGPSEELRDSIRRSVSTLQTEGELERLLGEIDRAASEDLTWVDDLRSPLDEETAEDLLADVEAWAALTSYAVIEFYTGYEPDDVAVGASHFRKVKSALNLAPGWDKSVVKRLRQIERTL